MNYINHWYVMVYVILGVQEVGILLKDLTEVKIEVRTLGK